MDLNSNMFQTTICFKQHNVMLNNTFDTTTCISPKNGLIALWPNTHVVKCKYFDSQKHNGFNNKYHCYNMLLTFVS